MAAGSTKSNIALSLSYIRDPAAKVRELCTYASQVEVEPSVPARRYLRSGLEMLRMAKVYRDEGDLESSFILYLKFITLFVEKLPKHPNYKEAPQKDVANIKTKVKQVIPVAEDIKTKLKAKYTAIESRRAEEKRLQAEQLAIEEERIRQEEEKRRLVEEERLRKLKEESEELWLKEQEEKFRQLQEREKQKQNEKDKHDLNILLVDVPLPSDNSPSVDRSTKPVDHFLNTGVSSPSTNKYGLKDVMIPRDIVVKFMRISESNTRRNVETCGILAGKMERGAFFITHVLIPKQSGTSDSCNAENEEDIFDFQDSHDLISLGWIHTHPSQTAFLSSVDLHTHYPYQQLMPEAVAVVVSPKFNETGVFMLTPDVGLPEVARCSRRGHHEHTKHPPIFETCSHAKFVDTSSINMVDLRSK